MELNKIMGMENIVDAIAATQKAAEAATASLEASGVDVSGGLVHEIYDGIRDAIIRHVEEEAESESESESVFDCPYCAGSGIAGQFYCPNCAGRGKL